MQTEEAFSLLLQTRLRVSDRESLEIKSPVQDDTEQRNKRKRTTDPTVVHRALEDAEPTSTETSRELSKKQTLLTGTRMTTDRWKFTGNAPGEQRVPTQETGAAASRPRGDIAYGARNWSGVLWRQPGKRAGLCMPAPRPHAALRPTSC
ncbi:hypothetical protein SKAU_G00146680 [Synaphobranchus kaupii]|uniref:Uncharacterized protein n=1 Tax=Synaphobranchus kaupii TaxID=118154 RepID=A0A9Q1J2N4_SYNKA|nr:hypothetical protein SKAU_G00146680 [Synaphobranchus kaupii]